MLNKVILIGNLGKDPETKTFENGNSIVNFTLATNESYKDRNGDKQKRTDWHNIQIGIPGLVKLAQQYLKKGDSIYLEGQIRTREYEKEGQKRYVTEIHADSIKFMPKGNNNDSSNGQNQAHASENTVNKEEFVNTNNSDPFSDDLPF
jgi:single-strand DNA-binding protein